jgi:hypothetical protein
VCQVILSDPDRSDFAEWNKKKAQKMMAGVGTAAAAAELGKQ